MTEATNVAPAAPGQPEITGLGHDVQLQIDTKMAGYDGITAGYLIRGSRPCLVDTGTAPSAPVVRTALDALGVGPADLATVVVTHIHLDHAGGTGDMAGHYPGAEIVVHERGARHLADPGRLMASARRVYGDSLDRLFGELAPTPADRIRAVDEVGRIDLGDGRWLESHYSPGHARHHVGLLDSVSGDLYVGDAAGVYLPETGDLRAATPPPDFDLEQALGSLRKFGTLRPTRLLFSFATTGPVNAADETLRRSAEEMLVWVDRDPAGPRRRCRLTSTTRSRWWPSAPGSVTPPSAMMATRRPRGWSGSAGRRATSQGSCAGWTNPNPRISRPRVPEAAGPRGGSRLGQVLDDDVVHFFESLGRVGLRRGVGRRRAAEPVTCLVGAYHVTSPECPRTRRTTGLTSG